MSIELRSGKGLTQPAQCIRRPSRGLKKGEPLQENCVPTCIEVLSAIAFERSRSASTVLTNEKLYLKIAEKISEIYARANIKTLKKNKIKGE